MATITDAYLYNDSLNSVGVYPMQPNVRASISEFISYAHTSVNEVSYCKAPWLITTLTPSLTSSLGFLV